MNATQRARALAVVAAMTAGVAYGQTTYVAPNAVTTPSGAVVNTAPPPADMNAWVYDYSARHQGRISRQAYLDEMGRRWDAADTNQQGLTPAEVSRLTGRVDTNAPVPLSGSGVQAGNMGPGNTKGQ